MDDSDPTGQDWIQQWIEQQRVALGQRCSQLPAGVSEELRQQLLDLGTKWLDLGHTYLVNLQQFAAGTQAATAEGGRSPCGPAEEFLTAWRNQWRSPLQPTPSQSQGAELWTQVLRQLPPLGLAREHHTTWRELARAHAECQRLEQALRAMLYEVQTQALNRVEQRVRECQAAHSTLEFRELYEVWVECGEQAYAQVAHSEAYCQLQAQLGNSAIQVRAQQQKLMEHALKQLDLPTRSELNSVHRQLREQARTLRELQEQIAVLQAQQLLDRDERA